MRHDGKGNEGSMDRPCQTVLVSYEENELNFGQSRFKWNRGGE